MKIGFIGCGNMASAIIKGIIESGAVAGNDVFVYDTDNKKTATFQNEYSINICGDEKEVATEAEYIVLAVKPNVLSSVLKKIDPVINTENKTLVSIAAGKTISFIAENLTHENKIIRVMPNINAKVQSACCAYCFNESVEEADKEVIEKIFNSVGSITALDESYFPLFGVIGGCAPAFAYMFIDELARAAVKHGMAKDTALKFSAQTVMGSAKMVLESGIHPYQLIDMVCSPGGTTVEGVLSLQADGFEKAVHNAVDKAVEKDKKL